MFQGRLCSWPAEPRAGRSAVRFVDDCLFQTNTSTLWRVQTRRQSKRVLGVAEVPGVCQICARKTLKRNRLGVGHPTRATSPSHEGVMNEDQTPPGLPNGNTSMPSGKRSVFLRYAVATVGPAV